MLCTGRAEDRVASAPHGWAWKPWRLLFQAFSPKNNARLAVMMLEVLAFPLDTNDVVNSLETTERKIKEFEGYANIKILDFLRIGIASAPHGWAWKPWRLLFQAFSPKNNARLVVMMLEVLAFRLDTNDVVNSLETTEREIKEFERYANIKILDFLKIGIVIRQAEERPMRTHLIINSHKLATLQSIKTEVTNVKQAQSAVMARSGRRNGRGCFHENIQGCFQKFWQETRVRGRLLVLREERSSTFRQSQEAKGQRQCGKMGYMSKGCRSNETRPDASK